MPKRIGLSLAVIFLAFFLLSYGACSPKENQEKNAEQDAVAIDMIVDHDSLFGIRNNTAIGDIWFSDSVGLVGTPIRVVVTFDDEYFKKFKDQPVFGTITMADPSSIKTGDYTVDFTITERQEEFQIIVPQVKTVPTMLDFEVVLSAENPDDATKYFQASLEYQFLVNQGLPAT